MLAFLLPVIEEYVLEQLGEFGVVFNALSIVQLSKQLDVKRQSQHRPCTLAEHRPGDCVGVDVEAIAVRQHLADHRVDAAEQSLVLQLTGSLEAVARLQFPQNVACGFPALRSSAGDSQHCKSLQLRVRETQLWFQ